MHGLRPNRIRWLEKKRNVLPYALHLFTYCPNVEKIRPSLTMFMHGQKFQPAGQNS